MNNLKMSSNGCAHNRWSDARVEQERRGAVDAEEIIYIMCINN